MSVSVSRLRIVGACALVLLLLSSTSAAASPNIIGALEGVDADGIVVGWTTDLNSPSTSNAVHFYVDGLAGSGGTPIGGIYSSIPRTDLAYPGSYGFRFSIPSQYRDGEVHLLYAYGVNLSGGSMLAGAPQAFTLASTVVRLQNGIISVGLDSRCGGTLVELSVQGRNLVNQYDCGRQVQAAAYDGNHRYDSCAGCDGVWGWDPVQGGDRYNFGSPVLRANVAPDSVYLVTQPYEWYPDNKGGGPGWPVLSDLKIEQTASFVSGHPNAVRLHYRITHLGSDTHANSEQELPAVYVNRGYDKFVYYGGTTPWAQRAVTWDTLSSPGQPVPLRYVPERWAAAVNSSGFGLTVYVPLQYPYVAGIQFPGSSGEYGFGANYFRPVIPFTFGPNSVFEGDVFVIAGNYDESRQTIYALRASEPVRDVLPPFGYLDLPSDGQMVSGTTTVSGWSFDNTQMARVDVLIDGTVAGRATYGLSRPDVATAFPNAPQQTGFFYDLNTAQYANGLHRVAIRATDTIGNAALLPESSIVVSNGSIDGIRPTVSITSTSKRRQTLTVAVQAVDNVGVARVKLYIDGRLAGTLTSSPYSFRVDLRTLAPGTHRLVAKAYDAAGNVGVSRRVTWTVS